jgi:hypothetical protein
MRRDDAEKDTICGERKADYFSLAIWTTQITLNRLAKLVSVREVFRWILEDRERDCTPKTLTDLPDEQASPGCVQLRWLDLTLDFDRGRPPA